MFTETTLHLRIKKNYAADVINDLQKMNAIEFVKQPIEKNKPIKKKSPAVPEGKPISATALKALLLESETQTTTSFETIKTQWQTKRKKLLK